MKNSIYQRAVLILYVNYYSFLAKEKTVYFSQYSQIAVTLVKLSMAGSIMLYFNVLIKQEKNFPKWEVPYLTMR